jgi:hypothetical protein
MWISCSTDARLKFNTKTAIKLLGSDALRRARSEQRSDRMLPRNDNEVILNSAYRLQS